MHDDDEDSKTKIAIVAMLVMVVMVFVMMMMMIMMMMTIMMIRTMIAKLRVTTSTHLFFEIFIDGCFQSHLCGHKHFLFGISSLDFLDLFVAT